MKTIVITSTDELWQKASEDGIYTQSTIDTKLADVGFIHATNPHQTIPMLNRHFSERNDILLLLVDLSKIKPEVKFEKPLSGRDEIFPHIYGPLNVDAVYDTVRPEKDSDHKFIESSNLSS